MIDFWLPGSRSNYFSIGLVTSNKYLYTLLHKYFFELTFHHAYFRCVASLKVTLSLTHWRLVALLLNPLFLLTYNYIPLPPCPSSLSDNLLIFKYKFQFKASRQAGVVGGSGGYGRLEFPPIPSPDWKPSARGRNRGFQVNNSGVLYIL